MATVTDVEVANAGFPTVRQDLNNILEAIATNFSADAEPTTMYANQFWYETDTNLLKMRNEANDAWITLAYMDQTSGEWQPRTAVVQAVDAAGLAFKTDEGTTRVTIADDGSVTVSTSLDVDNIKIDGNSITSTDTNGNINITPNGTGKVVLDGLSYPTADGTDGQVLTTDGSGNIAFEDVAGGITQADVWRLTADLSSNADITVNLERADDASSGLIGSGVSHSSGVFTFPETGIWQVTVFGQYVNTGGTRDSAFLNTFVSVDGGSNFDQVASAGAGADPSGSVFLTMGSNALVDCTSTSNVKVKFNLSSLSVGFLEGDTAISRTSFSFIRLGDT